MAVTADSDREANPQPPEDKRYHALPVDFWNAVPNAPGTCATTLQLAAPPLPHRGRGLQIPGTIGTESEIVETEAGHGNAPVNDSEKTLESLVHTAINHTAISETEAKPLWQRTFHLQPAAHAAVIATLAICRALQGGDEGCELGFMRCKVWMVVACFALLGLLFAAQLLSMVCGQACAPPRLLLALLQAGMCLSSVPLRPSCMDSTAGKPQEEGLLAMQLGILQLVSSSLYPGSVPASLITALVFSAALLIFQLIGQAPVGHEHAWEYHLIPAALAWISIVSAPAPVYQNGLAIARELFFFRLQAGAEDGDQAQSVQLLDGARQQEQALYYSEVLQAAFRPLFALKQDTNDDSPQVGTYLTYIVSKINKATHMVDISASLPVPLRQVVVDALKNLAKELGSTSLLQRMPECSLANSSTMMVQYVNTMLQPQVIQMAHALSDGAKVRTKAGSSEDLEESIEQCDTWRSSRSGHSGKYSDKSTSYVDIVAAMAALLNPQRSRDEASTPGMTDVAFKEFSVAVGLELGTWHAKLLDIFDNLEVQKPIVVLGGLAVRASAKELDIDPSTINAFLEGIEERYNAATPFHNSLHAADVVNSLLYFLNLPAGPCESMDDFHKFTALLVASAHDVGHTGVKNRYHTVVQTPLARLFNDQSVLENMHCAIMFAVLKVDHSNILDCLDEQSQVMFRSIAVQMILSTDLAKHVQVVGQFRQEFVVDGAEPDSNKGELTGAQRRDFLTFLLKASDVGGSVKPFSLHAQWTVRIFTEFFAQGDAERALGYPCSPFCDRTRTSLGECQTGFFGFVVSPLFEALGEYLDGPRIKFEILKQMEENRSFWKGFDDEGIDHRDMMANITKLQSTFVVRRQRAERCTRGAKKIARACKDSFASDPSGGGERTDSPSDRPDPVRCSRKAGSSTDRHIAN